MHVEQAILVLCSCDEVDGSMLGLLNNALPLTFKQEYVDEEIPALPTFTGPMQCCGM